MIEGALRRDRVLVVSAIVAATALSWAYLLTGAGMSMHEMDGMLMPMGVGPWTLGYAALLLMMWGAMMAAMMLPSAAPMILFYGSIAKRRQERGDPAATGAFAGGYLAIWATFSFAAVVLQFGLEQAALLSSMMQTTSVAFAGALLIAAGIYQWTPLKQACLRRCRSPLDFVMTEWREGKRGAWVMGLRHGSYCVGCCWVLMLLLLVGGVMNLSWIGGLALFVMVEKIAPAGHWIGRVAGLGLIAWGSAVLAGLSCEAAAPH
jgi:predicted metal-binding membrane protein